MKVIDCKSIREDMLTEARNKIASLPKKLRLAIIQVDGDDASEVYIRNKIKTAESVGVECCKFKFSNNTSYEELSTFINYCNDRHDTTGVMLQLPLPDHLKQYERELLDMISWDKDVDGLSSDSVGRLWTDKPCITPATPTGLLRLLPRDLSHRKVTIINRSNLIGKPLIKMLLDRDATVEICHSKTPNINTRFNRSDIVITGIGKPKYFYPAIGLGFSGRIFIDCGISRDEDGKLCGDIDLKAFEKSDDSLTPVPGGIGILTTAQLMLNVIKAYELQEV